MLSRANQRITATTTTTTATQGGRQTIYKRYIQVLCISSVIGLTLLSLHRPSSSLPSSDIKTKKIVVIENDEEAVGEDWMDFVNDYQQRFHRGPPPDGFPAWLQFAKQNQCETRNFYESLDQDLEYFRSNNQKSSSLLQWEDVIPVGLNVTNNYIAFALENHELKIVAYQTDQEHETTILQWMKWFLKPIVEHSPPLYSRFIFNLHDGAGPKSVNSTYPMFSLCKMDYYTDHQNPPPPSTVATAAHNNTQLYAYATDMFWKQPKEPRTGTVEIDQDYLQSKDLLVPYHFSLQIFDSPSQQPASSLRWWRRPLHRRRNGDVPFAKRKNVITWRGSTTSPWETGIRFKFMKEFGGRDIHPLSLSHANNTNHTTGGGGDSIVNADFAFVRVVQQPPQAKNLSMETYRFAPHMEYREMQQNKYILDIDGNAFSSRFPGLLRSGSLVFKSTRYREWFHGRLLPYMDYIPVNYDLTDLVDKVEWVHNNKNNTQQYLVERIIQHSRRRVEKLLRPVEMQCYMYRLLLEYQTLFEKPPRSVVGVK